MTENPKLISWMKRFWSTPAYRFPVAFVLLWVALDLVLASVHSSSIWFRNATILLTKASSNWMGLQAAATGTVVSFGGGKFAYDIEAGCSGIAVVVVLVSALAAYPAPWRARAWGLLLAVPFVFVVNVSRLVTMGWAGLRNETLFHYLHMIVWQAFVFVVAALAFIGWAFMVQRKTEGRKASAIVKEIGTTFGIFLLVFVPLWYLGARRHGMQAYGLFSDFLMSVFQTVMRVNVIHPDFSIQANQVTFGVTPYLTWAGFVSLFLATPRMPWKKRIVGAFAILTPIMLLLPALVWAIHFQHPFPPIARSIFSGTILFGLPMLVWLVWARPIWLPLARRPWRSHGQYACPQCKTKHADLLFHVETKHPKHAKKLLGRIYERHPELRSPRS